MNVLKIMSKETKDRYKFNKEKGVKCQHNQNKVIPKDQHPSNNTSVFFTFTNSFYYCLFIHSFMQYRLGACYEQGISVDKENTSNEKTSSCPRGPYILTHGNMINVPT